MRTIAGLVGANVREGNACGGRDRGADHGQCLEGREGGWDQVAEEEVILIIESMKMEIPVEAPCAGRIVEIRAAQGESVEEGDVLVVLE